MKIHEVDEEQEYFSRMMGSLWVDFNFRPQESCKDDRWLCLFLTHIWVLKFLYIVTDIYLEHHFFPKFRNLFLEHQNNYT